MWRSRTGKHPSAQANGCEEPRRQREAWRGKRCTSKELSKYAEICRVANVMRPYLESMT